jgi:hypothetical protein
MNNFNPNEFQILNSKKYISDIDDNFDILIEGKLDKNKRSNHDVSHIKDKNNFLRQEVITISEREGDVILHQPPDKNKNKSINNENNEKAVINFIKILSDDLLKELCQKYINNPEFYISLHQLFVLRENIPELNLERNYLDKFHFLNDKSNYYKKDRESNSFWKKTFYHQIRNNIPSKNKKILKGYDCKVSSNFNDILIIKDEEIEFYDENLEYFLGNEIIKTILLNPNIPFTNFFSDMSIDFDFQPEIIYEPWFFLFIRYSLLLRYRRYIGWNCYYPLLKTNNQSHKTIFRNIPDYITIMNIKENEYFEFEENICNDYFKDDDLDPRHYFDNQENIFDQVKEKKDNISNYIPRYFSFFEKELAKLKTENNELYLEYIKNTVFNNKKDIAYYVQLKNSILSNNNVNNEEKSYSENSLILSLNTKVNFMRSREVNYENRNILSLLGSIYYDEEQKIDHCWVPINFLTKEYIENFIKSIRLSTARLISLSISTGYFLNHSTSIYLIDAPEKNILTTNNYNKSCFWISELFNYIFPQYVFTPRYNVFLHKFLEIGKNINNHVNLEKNCKELFGAFSKGEKEISIENRNNIIAPISSDLSKTNFFGLKITCHGIETLLDPDNFEMFLQDPFIISKKNKITYENRSIVLIDLLQITENILLNPIIFGHPINYQKWKLGFAILVILSTCINDFDYEQNKFRDWNLDKILSIVYRTFLTKNLAKEELEKINERNYTIRKDMNIFERLEISPFNTSFTRTFYLIKYYVNSIILLSQKDENIFTIMASRITRFYIHCIGINQDIFKLLQSIDDLKGDRDYISYQYLLSACLPDKIKAIFKELK